MAFESVFDFVVAVVAGYIGAMAALRRFFGREYYDPRTGEQVDEAGSSDESNED